MNQLFLSRLIFSVLSNLFMLNFVMAILYEPQIYNPLTEFLLQRSTKDFNFIGSQFYWMIR